MCRIFLHGGGDDVASRRETFGQFVAAMMVGETGKLALVLEEEETAVFESQQAYSTIFTSIGFPADNIAPIYATKTNPLTYEMLVHIAPSGLFVCGGVTPSYQQALCINPAWLAYLHETQIPYGGTSAGAAIAAQTAIVGGWQAQQRDILFVGASEGIDPLTTKQGLGLVPFAVDVHASQMGTLTRLIHAVKLGLVDEGWAIDENTLLAVSDQQMRVYGRGHCYHVWRQSENVVQLSIHVAGAV